MAAHVLPNPLSTTAWTKDQFASKWQFPAASSAALAPSGDPTFTSRARLTAYIVSFNGEPLPNWVRPTALAFNEIGTLTDNWDTYDGKAISSDLMKQSFSFLQAIMQPNSPVPSVVPLGDGGIQLEWHRNRQDLEVTFAADEAARFFYIDRASGTEQEGFVSEIENLAELLGRLA